MNDSRDDARQATSVSRRDYLKRIDNRYLLQVKIGPKDLRTERDEAAEAW